MFAKAGIPAAFTSVESYFWHPVFSGQPKTAAQPEPKRVLEALEQLLWQWKGPLAREWYPYLFGLKGDLLIARGEMENKRIDKTQTNALAPVLTEQRLPALFADSSD